MIKIKLILTAVFLSVTHSITGLFASGPGWKDIGRGNLDIRSVLIDPDNPRIIYMGSGSGIFYTADSGLNWRIVLLTKGKRRPVNFLLFDPQDKNCLYAATGNGLFYAVNQGKNWKRIFQGRNSLESECTTLAVLPDAIYLGTRDGLFVSRDRGRSWHRQSGEVGRSSILAIACNLKEPGYMYLACVAGVFKSKDSGQTWEKTFIALPAESGDEKEEITEDRDEEGRLSCPRYISIDPNNADYLYLATSKGVYSSQDKGGNWQAFSSFGLLNREVRFLLVSSESRLLAVAKSGVFEYMNNRWRELSLGLATEEVRSLALDKENNLYAACDKGLFKTEIESANKSQDGMIGVYYKNEPEIKDVQRVAMKYAEVEPEKIKLWRKQAAKKALLPKVTLAMDRQLDRTVSNSIWGTYPSNGAAGRYFVGPDDITKYNNKNWSVSLTWELGDLIWSDAQTSIDVRSRLMVELRDDILDEVTRLYFERIRVKMELDSLSIEERRKRSEKEIRIQELTASLDALTGGYFSGHAISSNPGL